MIATQTTRVRDVVKACVLVEYEVFLGFISKTSAYTLGPIHRGDKCYSKPLRKLLPKSYVQNVELLTGKFVLEFLVKGGSHLSPLINVVCNGSFYILQ